MDANDYQRLTESTDMTEETARDFTERVYGTVAEQIEYLRVMYCTGKLNGEAGEIAEVVFKGYRDDNGILTPEVLRKLYKELGDVLWYVARIAAICNFRLSDIMMANLDKLQDRKNRGVLHGSGDDR